MDTLQILSYALGLSIVVLFGVAAVSYSLWRQYTKGPDTPEFFLTARRSVGAFTITWAFYAGAMGSWALFGPPSYVLAAGVLGLIMYSLSSGIPIIIVAALGGMVHELVPNVISFSDFVNRRFGLSVSLYVAALMLFNMGIAITAEYTAVGDLFEYILGVNRIPIVVTIGVVSVLYTAVGGLFVSIITDQWQAGMSVIFILILVIYVAITFKSPLGPLPDNLGWGNYYGLSSIAVMPISLTASTLFSEAMWQRCWATSTRKSLIIGSCLGCLLITGAVFILGFGGLLAAWSGVWEPASPDDNGNTILFSLFNGKTWILVIVGLLAVCMSTSAVDSLQNAIADTIASIFSTIAKAVEQVFPSVGGSLGFVKDLNIWWIRFLVLALNVAPVIISLKGYNVLQLFLLANLITTCTAAPVCLGVIQGPLSRKVITPFSVIFGCLSGLASLFWWSAIYANQTGLDYSAALYNVFFFAYSWPPFLVGLGMSMGGLLFGAVLEFIARMVVPDWRNYPEYPLGATTGHISHSTADILTKAYNLEASRTDEEDAEAEQDYGPESGVFEDTRDANLSTNSSQAATSWRRP